MEHEIKNPARKKIDRERFIKFQIIKKYVKFLRFLSQIDVTHNFV